MADLQKKLDKTTDTILAKRPQKAVTLALVNEKEKQYTVVGLGDWRIADRKPFQLLQDGYTFVSKYQAGLCAEE